MKGEDFDKLTQEQKIAHLSEMASKASFATYRDRKALKKDKEAGETLLPGHHTVAKESPLFGLFEESE